MYLKTSCTPRESVFNRDRRDVVLDLSDLMESKIDAEDFFEENFITSGMKTLLEKTFSRLEGSIDQASTFLLAQANQPYKNTIKKEPSLAKMEMRSLLPGTAG
jgi:hypothetical protein